MAAWRQDDEEERMSASMLTYTRRREGRCVLCGLVWDDCDCGIAEDVSYADDGEERRY